MANKILPTTVVGSYPQPDWLVNREMLSKSVPRVRMNIWRIPDEQLEQAQDDATILAIRDMERAGIDIITDGEARRESYSNRFATALVPSPASHAARTSRRNSFEYASAIGSLRSRRNPTYRTSSVCARVIAKPL